MNSILILIVILFASSAFASDTSSELDEIDISSWLNQGHAGIDAHGGDLVMPDGRQWYYVIGRHNKCDTRWTVISEFEYDGRHICQLTDGEIFTVCIGMRKIVGPNPQNRRRNRAAASFSIKGIEDHERDYLTKAIYKFYNENYHIRP